LKAVLIFSAQRLPLANLTPMLPLYFPVLLLQAFCVYHAYKNNNGQKWYWLILFLPVIGCLIYLFENFYSRKGLETIAEGVKGVVITNYRIEQLEKELRFSDNITNKTNLADEYLKCERYKDAAALYQECLQGFMADDSALISKLLRAHFLSGNYAAVLQCADKLGSEKTFKNSEERVDYAWALYHEGKADLADVVFQDMDKQFTNHRHRTEYAKFLLLTGKAETARAIMVTLMEEFEHMKDIERRLKRGIIREVRDLYANHVGA
jgi:hypothetical protein